MTDKTTMAKLPASGERLHKYLASIGVASRRTIESWIEQKKVRVNGRMARLGDKVSANSCITVPGRTITAQFSRPQTRVILYHKPEGEISTRKDPSHRRTVFMRLPKLKGARWVAVGRLDINTRGLLLFTNDGELANRLMHPCANLEREYYCRVYGKVDADSIQRLRQGIRLGRELIRFRQVHCQSRHKTNSGMDDTRRNTWYSVVVCEGKYREIRRMWEAVGCKLSRLIRVRYGNVVLPKTLQSGHWQELKPTEIATLSADVEASAPVADSDKPTSVVSVSPACATKKPVKTKPTH